MSASKKIKKGISLYQEKKYQQAVGLFKEALVIDPRAAEAHYYMALLSSIGGNASASMHFFDNALAIEPNNAAYHFDKGRLHELLGDIPKAVERYYSAVLQTPENNDYCQNLINVIRKLRFHAPNPQLLVTLNALMTRPKIDGSSAMYSWTSLYLLSPEFLLLKQGATEGAAIENHLCLQEPLLINAMAYNTLQEASLEDTLVTLRKKLSSAALNQNMVLFLTAMAQQCFMNEYIWEVTAEEEARIITLRQTAEAGNATLAELLLLATYQPLFSIRNIELYQGSMNDNEISALVWRRQVSEPKREAEIKKTLTSLTPIEDEVSAKVQAQYEENPYPRWDEMNLYQAREFKDYLRNLLPFLKRANLPPFGSKAKVLIAGTGTGRHVLGNANLFPKHDFIAIDLSSTSLAYAIRKKEEMFANAQVDFAQADILRLEEAFAPETFDIIECCGVLHHMHDPMAGWEVLARLLKKGGYMKIALYSKTARLAISKIRQKIQDEGYPSSVQGIRAMRKYVKVGAAQDKDLDHLTHSPDFYSTSACRDLLFHVQEHQFTLPQIKQAIEKLGLEFLGMDLHDAHAQAEFRKMFSLKMDSAPTIEQWEEFEKQHPSIFGGMYQFWLQKE
ncbi:MAG: methyltransferase domain-containing protein [Alphaproteobacteria bacterium]|nr:methyltransferase domain-containing protein [Alphaproteobacteria bacterium]